MTDNGARNLKLISDYKNIEKYRASFNNLAGEVFGIDFEPWYKAGFWNERYVCYSYAAGDTVVSNVSINKMDLVICGEAKKAIQIGTVMTHAAYRKKGLSKELMNIVVGEYASKCDLIYLFANESAYGFYPGFGFDEFSETSFSVSGPDFYTPGSSGGGSPADKNGPALRKLDIDNEKDLETLKRLAFKRVPVSNKLGVMNDSHLIMFYCIKYYKDSIYYIDSLDAVVIYKIEEGSLYLYDILTESGAGINEIMPAIMDAANKTAAEKIVFMFTPDRSGIEISGHKEEKDYKLFVRPSCFKNSDELVFPRLSHA